MSEHGSAPMQELVASRAALAVFERCLRRAPSGSRELRGAWAVLHKIGIAFAACARPRVPVPQKLPAHSYQAECIDTVARLRLAICFLCGTGVVLLSGVALPSPAQAVELSFTAPRECGSADELQRHVSKVVGLDAWDVSASVAIVSTEDRRFRLTVTVADETRIVSDSDCRALFDTAVLMVSLGCERHIQKLEAAARTTPPSVELKTESSAPPGEASRSKARSRRGSSALWLEGGVVHGIVPGWDPTLGIGGQAGGDWLVASLALHYNPPRNDNSERLSVQSLGGRALLMGMRRKLGWLGAGVEGALLFGRGQHLDASYRGIVTRSAGCAELGVVLFTRGVHQLSLSSDLAVAIQRARFRIRHEAPSGPSEVVYRPGIWALSFALRWQLQITR